MPRDKRRFTFITRFREPAGAAIVRSQPIEEDALETTERFHRFFDSGPPQTAVGIIGGLVGTFLDGRYFALVGLYLVYGLVRSRALRGLTLVVKLVVAIAFSVITCSGFFWMGVQINRARPHIFTPSEYLAAAKAGSPLPIVQQITQYYPQKITNTRVIETPAPAHTHVIFADPVMIPNPVEPNVPMVSVGYINRGNSVILHASMRMILSYFRISEQCSEEGFQDFERKVEYGLAGPMLGANDAISKSIIPSNAPIYPSNSPALRLVAGVQWEDESGLYITTTYQYLNPLDNRWHTCPAHNGEQKINKKDK